MTRETLSTGSLLLLALSCSGRLDVGAKATGGASGAGDAPGTGGDAQGGTGGVVARPGGFTSKGGTGPDPGTPGAPCVPGGLALEAPGTPAEAQVKTQDRCNEGYTCSPAKVCVPTENCAGNSGADCVVYAVADADRNGTGGAASDLNWTGGTTSFDNGPAIAQPAITGLRSDGSRLYFTAYGTRDRLGNFNNDGALSVSSLADGSTTTIASELPGPIALGLTSSHAYIVVDGAPLLGSNTHHRLLRVALSGGQPEVVQDNPAVEQFGGCLSAGSRAFWSGPDGTYTISADERMPSLFLAGAFPSATDASHLYYAGGDWTNSSIWRVPIDGGMMQELTGPAYPFGVRNGFLYAAESLSNPSGVVLDRAPASGGNWQRIRALGAGEPTAFQADGDRYFILTIPPAVGPDLPVNFWRRDLLTATFSSDSPPVRILERTMRRTLVDDLWVGTEKSLFWSDGNKIYSRAVADEP